MDNLTTESSFLSQATWVINVCGLFLLTCYPLVDVRSTGVGIKCLCNCTGLQRIHPPPPLLTELYVRQCLSHDLPLLSRTSVMPPIVVIKTVNILSNSRFFSHELTEYATYNQRMLYKMSFRVYCTYNRLSVKFKLL